MTKHKVSSAALDDGRLALREAIAACTEAERVHRLNKEAFERAEAAVVDSYGPETEAEGSLEKARAEAPARLAAEFRGDAPEPGQTVEEAEAALAAIRQNRVAARAARDMLEQETRRAAQAAHWERRKVKDVVSDLVKVSPTTRSLLDAHVEAERRFLALRSAVDVLRREGALPDGFGTLPSLSPSEADQTIGLAWKAALDALHTDPDAPLPELSGVQ